MLVPTRNAYIQHYESREVWGGLVHTCIDQPPGPSCLLRLNWRLESMSHVLQIGHHLPKCLSVAVHWSLYHCPDGHVDLCGFNGLHCVVKASNTCPY